MENMVTWKTLPFLYLFKTNYACRILIYTHITSSYILKAKLYKYIYIIYFLILDLNFLESKRVLADFIRAYMLSMICPTL